MADKARLASCGFACRAGRHAFPFASVCSMSRFHSMAQPARQRFSPSSTLSRRSADHAATSGPLSHVLLPHEPAARARARRSQLFRTDAGAERRAGGERPRARSSGFLADRLRQDHRLWPRHRRDAAGRRRKARPRRRAAGADHRADARAGAAGAARTRLALRPDRRAGDLLRRRHGPAPRGRAARRGRPYRRRHARPPARPYRAAPPRRLRAARPSCSTRPTRCSISASATISNSS